MKGEWCYFKSYFNKETCDRIIRDALVIPPQDALVGMGNTEHVDSSIRRSKIRFINAGDWRFQYLFDALWKTCIQANKDFFNVHVTKLDFIQFAEYSADYQGEYKEHHDVFWLTENEYHRKLSCVIQLTDPSEYEGGEFNIHSTFAPDQKDLRAQGTVIYFPSMFTHRAHQVTKGVRYSIAAWFEGPKWR